MIDRDLAAALLSGLRAVARDKDVSDDRFDAAWRLTMALAALTQDSTSPPRDPTQESCANG